MYIYLTLSKEPDRIHILPLQKATGQLYLCLVNRACGYVPFFLLTVSLLRQEQSAFHFGQYWNNTSCPPLPLDKLLHTGLCKLEEIRQGCFT